jgi:invasion protein IalB
VQAGQGTQAERPQATTTPSGGGAVEHVTKAFQDQVAPRAPVEKPPVFEFASAVQPGEHPGPGEFVRTIRTYVHWTLVCDALIGKRRICFLEQRVAADDGASLTWQIAQTVNGHVMMILKAPAGISETAGIKLSLSGFERTETALHCDASGCLAVLPFEGRAAEWITSEASVGFGFEANGRPYQFTMSMDGFKQAVDSIPRAAPAKAAARRPEPQDGKANVRTVHRAGKGTEPLGPVAADGGKDF